MVQIAERDGKRELSNGQTSGAVATICKKVPFHFFFLSTFCVCVCVCVCMRAYVCYDSRPGRISLIFLDACYVARQHAHRLS